jgi:hypothetical protein
MRLFLCLLLVTGCAELPTEARLAPRSAGWKHKVVHPAPVISIDCITVVDTVTIWLDGVPYLELVEQCR